MTELREEQRPRLERGGRLRSLQSPKMEGLISDDINFELYQGCIRGGFRQMRDISRFNITGEINAVL